ncbi:polysaccharide transporter, PST family [Lentibacillus halodurans]|uniref:Polysaccharide transporter, PST family n=1 Tax=Lentibacillus halodurans TaxID=237679 RepID=A0A1I0XJA4_9BACI|nr:lipopolysaccharide biosynthesis protein [Lentibacillus halodurans]SFB01071.1 polysaccharide transporter, PST family [Lentibacillus halodurans]
MNSKSFLKISVQGFNWMFLGKIIQFIMQFIVTVVLARLLTPTDFGIIGAAIIVITLVEVLSMAGVGPAIVQRSQIKTEHLGTGFTIAVLFNFVFSIIIYFCSPIIASFFNMVDLNQVMKVISVIFIIRGFGVVAEFLLQRNLNFKTLALINMGSYFTYSFIGIILASFGFGVWSLVFAQLSQKLTSTVLFIFCQPHNKHFKIYIKEAKELLYFGGGMILAKGFNQLALQGDNLVIGRTLGSEALGFYSRAYQLMVMPANLFGQVMDKVLFPVMSKFQDDNERLTKWFLSALSLLTVFISPIMILFLIYTENIVVTLLGVQWLEIILPLKILSIGLLFRISYKISDSLVRAKGAVYKRANIQFVYAFLVIFGAYLGHFWGVTGVAVTVTIALSINYFLMTYLAMKLLNSKWFWLLKQYYKPFILFIVVLCLFKFIKESNVLLTNNTSLELVIAGIIIFLFYLLLVAFTPQLLLDSNSTKLLNRIKYKTSVFK